MILIVSGVKLTYILVWILVNLCIPETPVIDSVPRCGYPMCDQECAEDETHQQECKILSRGQKPTFDENGETEAYHCILPLRLLLLSRQDPDRFSLSDHLMDHEEERHGSEDWKTTERTVVDNLVNICGGAEHENMTVGEVRRALGVLEVNCYEVYSFIKKIGAHSCGLRGCFPAASLLSHSCLANSRHIWGTCPPYTNTCIATTDIEAGQEIVTSYAHPTTSQIRRRKKLKAGWYFECSCKRCCSKDELGTNHSTMVCPECSKATLLPVDPLELGSPWICECGLVATEDEISSTIDKLHDGIKKITDSNRYNMDLWLRLVDFALKSVHHHHDVIIEIAKFLIPIMCRGPGMTTDDFPLELVRRKLQIATWHYDVVKVIDPGYSKSRIKMLYEITETKIFLMFREKNIDRDNLKDLVITALNDLSQIIIVMERLIPDKGFETMIVAAARNLHSKCKEIKNQLESNSFNKNLWIEESWYLLDLCYYEN